MTETLKLTNFSHGYGCGCKLPPETLARILKSNIRGSTDFPGLLVGNDHHDDAAVLDMGNGMSLISTVDFFMPVVDDAFDFGRIAATNAISDIYAMGGKPVLAVAILGWPADKIPAEIASEVIRGANTICGEANIPLAGGHSIDSPEPFFGLAVNGFVNNEFIRRNNTATEGDLLFITKKIGTGIISTAVKKNVANQDHINQAVHQMTTLNKAGEHLSKLDAVTAMTDITGFGLFGHLIEMASGSNLSAEIDFNSIQLLPGIDAYMADYSIPALTYRNWNSYSDKITEPTAAQLHIGCDPQTSGGLLIAVKESKVKDYLETVREFDVFNCALKPVGKMIRSSEKTIILK